MAISPFGKTILGVTTSFFAVALGFVGLRLWAHRVSQRSWKVYDTLILVGLVFEAAQLASLYYQVLNGGLGSHMGDLSTLQVVDMNKGFTATSIFWIIGSNIVKLSILLFYLDIFRISQRIRQALYGFVSFIAVYGVASILCVFTICRPFPKLWDTNLPGRCGSIMTSMFATAIVNCVEDLAVVLLPLPLIWNLNMPTRKKVYLTAIIAFGLTTLAINLARLVLASPRTEDDASFSLGYQGLFLNLEVEIGLIAACLPTLRPLFTKSSLSSRSSSSRGYVKDYSSSASSSSAIKKQNGKADHYDSSYTYASELTRSASERSSTLLGDGYQHDDYYKSPPRYSHGHADSYDQGLKNGSVEIRLLDPVSSSPHLRSDSL